MKRNFIIVAACAGLALALTLLIAAILNRSILVFLMGALFMASAVISTLALSYAPPRKPRNPKR